MSILNNTNGIFEYKNKHLSLIPDTQGQAWNINKINNKYVIGHQEGTFVYENGLLDWRTYSTAICWGVALVIHAFTVFGPDIFFSSEWEQKKIQKYMEREAQNNNTKWQ